MGEADDEPGQLARELIAAYVEELRRYRRLLGTREEPINPTLSPDQWEVKQILDCPPEQVRLGDLERLERVDPERCIARWHEILERALRDLNNGWWSGRSLEPMGGSAWRRACFLAVRQALRQAWQPRNEGESLLIDEMAQYELLRQDWVAILATTSSDPKTRVEGQRRGAADENPRRITALEANREATQMVERLQRLFQNTMRTLLSLRRVKAPFIVQHSGQVNVAVGQQLNVNVPATPGTEPSEPPPKAVEREWAGGEDIEAIAGADEPAESIA
jgi:hypothetical protein